MATFTGKKSAVIWAQDTNGNFFSINGVTTAPTTDTNAVNQLNKIFAMVGKSFVTEGMQRVTIEEAN